MYCPRQALSNGQDKGVDKIFYNTLVEGKQAPDYSNSDDFKVELTLQATLQDRGFALFVESVQQALPDEQKLSVFEIITLTKIRDGKKLLEHDKRIVKKLLERKLVEKRGQTKGRFYILCRSYYEFTGDTATYSAKSDWDIGQMLTLVTPYLMKYKVAKMGDFVKLLDSHMTRRQIRIYVQKLVEKKVLVATGVGAGTRYTLSKEYVKGSEMLGRAMGMGLKVLMNEKSPISVQETADSTRNSSP